MKKILTTIFVCLLLTANVWANQSPTASQVATNCSPWSKNLNCTMTNQQLVDNALDQLNGGGGSILPITLASPNVGIGSTAPGQTLDVQGTARLTDLIAKSPITDFRYFGAKCDDSTDDTTAMTNALSFLYAKGGGTLLIPGMCKIAGQITLLNNGTGTFYSQPTIRITGLGESTNGGWASPTFKNYGLDLTFNAPIAKIVTYGVGTIELDHLTLKDSSSDSAAFFYTTNTQPMIHDVLFSGTASGTSAVNKMIILGGTDSLAGNATTSPFQGYGAVIERNFFDKCKQAVVMKNWVNNIVVQNNTVSLTCGDNTSGPFVIDSTGSAGDDTGNYFSGNTIEMSSYKYGFDLKNYGYQNTFIANGMYDGDAVITHAGYNFGSTSINNVIVNSFFSGVNHFADGDQSDQLVLGNSDEVYTNFNRRVGIGTTAPIAPLDVEGVGGVLLNSGAVGINTRSPNALLEITRAGSNDLFSLTNTFGKTWELKPGIPGVNDTSLEIRNKTDGLNAITFTSTGNVGIGTDVSGNRLFVYDPINPTRVVFRQNGTQADNSHLLDIQDKTGANVASFWSNGNIAGTQIETINDATAALDQGTNPKGVKVASTGGYYFSSTSNWWDTLDTGLSRGAAGAVYVGTGAQGNSSGTLIAGNIGVGSTHPGQAIDVQGTVRVTALIKSGGTSSQFLKADGSVDSSSYSTAVGANPTGTVGTSAVNGSSANFMRADGAPAINLTMSPTWTGNHIFSPSSGNTVITAGNVGIGSTTPGALLDVAGTLRHFYVNINGNVGINTNAPQADLTVKQTGSEDPLHVASSVNTSLFKVTGVGNVGVGSSAPGQILDVQGTLRTTAFTLTLSPLANGNVMVSNNVGIGTWMPVSTLPATSGGQVTSSSASQVSYFPSAGTTVQGANNVITDGNNVGIGTASVTGGAALTVMNGNVGLGTIGPVSKLEVRGGITTSGNVGIGTNLQNSALAVMGNFGIGTWNPNAAFQIGSGGNTWTNAGVVTSSGALTAGGTITASSAGFMISSASTQFTRVNTEIRAFGANGIQLANTQGSILSIYLTNVGIGTVGPSGGNLGIGTLTPGGRLGVVGNVGIGTNANSSLFVTIAPPNGGMIIEGNVGIGTFAPSFPTVLIGNIGVGTITTGSVTQAVTGSSCTQWTNGLCTHS